MITRFVLIGALAVTACTMETSGLDPGERPDAGPLADHSHTWGDLPEETNRDILLSPIDTATEAADFGSHALVLRSSMWTQRKRRS